MPIFQYTTKSNADLFREFDVTRSKGLSSEEVLRRRARYGPNDLTTKGVTAFQIFLRQFNSAFIYLLIGAGALAFILGEALDGFMIWLFVVINAVLGFYQEYASEKTLRLLNSYVVSRSRVLREGKTESVPSGELVPGDIILIEAGDTIPADVRFVEQQSLTLDESPLTGESIPIQKTHLPLHVEVTQAYQAANVGFAGTSVASGKGIGLVLATGKETAMGDIVRLTVATERKSGFEKGINQFSTFIVRLVLVTLVFVFIAHIAIRGESTSMFELVLFAIALAVSVIPEALPVVITFSLSRGALRLAKNKVVIKRLSAIEDLGGIEILCTDKTGTLTENALSVAHTFGDEQTLLLYASLASLHRDSREQHSINAFDTAIVNRLDAQTCAMAKKFAVVSDCPFDPERRRNSVVVKRGKLHELVVRGAPESVLTLCVKLAPIQRKKLQAWILKEGTEGRRVLALAKKNVPSRADCGPDEEHGLAFLGLVSFVDPLKKSSKNALASAKELGVQVKILTGDSKEVAGAIAYQVGLIESPEQVITGEELERMPSAEQVTAAVNHHVFARVSPQQKFFIITLLKQKHDVGFLGEGINDAPALKAASVGIVVNDATDIARSAADIILLRRSLTVIIDGIREGREVFANTSKYIRATLASNFGNFYAVSFASLLLEGLPMLPLQLLLLNLLTDTPMVAISTDRVDPGELKRPRSYDVKDTALVATVLGIVSTVFDFIYFGFFRTAPLPVLQTSWFVGSVLTELAFLFSIRTKLFFLKAQRPSTAVIVITASAFLAAIILPYTWLGQHIFKFQPLSVSNLALIFAIAACYFVVTEMVKNLYYRSNGNSGK